jgi:predicted transcriptional regulator
MRTPLEDIDWLTRSANRVELLELLADRPHTRSELQKALGVTRVTVNRTSEAFEERGWIEATDRELELTPCGRLVLDTLVPLRSAAATARKLGDIQQYLPTDEFDFALSRLADAEITYSSKYDVLAPVDESAEIAVGADRLRVVGNAPDSVHLQKASILYEDGEGPQSVERVFTSDGLDTIAAKPELSRRLRNIAALDDVECTYFRYDEALSYGLQIADETVVVELFNEEGLVPAVVVTDDETVHAWAQKRFERYKRASQLLDAAAFEA